MARKIKVFLVDDLDGSDNAETVEFSLDGTDYTIDLSATNKAKLFDALEPFVSSATKVGRKAKGRAGKSAAKSSTDLAAVREWARANGYKVSDRGRIPATVLDAYNAATGS
ncbi:MAG TPA: Lsr2 family protein [Tessaracoccus flavescens]|uniref:Lsr2 family protein n=1 Tax=Tessaracoccus flavescens TaxID=399497 RepID=A0A921JRQ8_9ACTN|nr:Lsr2 family protein [Tessaracoccus flavescens]